MAWYDNKTKNIRKEMVISDEHTVCFWAQKFVKVTGVNTFCLFCIEFCNEFGSSHLFCDFLSQ